MDQFPDRVRANMDVVLEEVCTELPNGCDHESRRYIAEQLIRAVRDGKTSLGELTYVGHRALIHLRNTSRSA